MRLRNKFSPRSSVVDASTSRLTGVRWGAVPMTPLLCFLALSVLPVGSDNEIEIDFVADPKSAGALFSPSAGLTGAKWLMTEGGLRATLPVGLPCRQASRLSARVNLEGDFQIIVQYRVNSLPRPSTPPPQAPEPSNNLEIAIAGKDLVATVFRNQRIGLGEGIGYFSKCPQGDSAVGHQPFKGGTSGQLGVRRVGQRLLFLYGDAHGPMIEFGSTRTCTTHITELGLQVLALNSPDALDVTFERLSIKADRLVRLEPPHHHRANTGDLRRVVIGHGVAFVVGLTYWCTRTRRREKTTSSSDSRVAAKPESIEGARHRRGFVLLPILVVFVVMCILIDLFLPGVRRWRCENDPKPITPAPGGREAARHAGSFEGGDGVPASGSIVTGRRDDSGFVGETYERLSPLQSRAGQDSVGEESRARSVRSRVTSCGRVRIGVLREGG